jgi:hypothetical protein
MSITRCAVALAATCILGPLPLKAVLASDITIPTGAAAAPKRAVPDRPQSARVQKTAPGRKRAEKTSRRQISSYNLDGPALKHGSGKTGLAASHGGIGLGTVGYTSLSGGPSLGRNNLSGVPLGTGFKADAANNTNGSDCREKTANTGPRRSEMTACFVHQLDRTWKTQTYVSRRSADGNTGWGGGLAVGFDY